jgi:hypothetical protein
MNTFLSNKKVSTSSPGTILIPMIAMYVPLLLACLVIGTVVQQGSARPVGSNSVTTVDYCSIMHPTTKPSLQPSTTPTASTTQSLSPTPPTPPVLPPPPTILERILQWLLSLLPFHLIGATMDSPPPQLRGVTMEG